MEIKINLIPPHKKEDIARAYWLRLVSKWEIEFVLLLVLLIAFLFSMNLVLKTSVLAENNAELLTEKNNDKYKLLEEYDNEIKVVIEQMAGVKKVQANQLYWSKVLLKINENFINGIEVVSLTTKNYDMTIAGRADTRDSLIAFKDKLAQDSCFANVDLPLSNLTSREDVEFQLSLKIKKECLKYE